MARAAALLLLLLVVLAAGAKRHTQPSSFVPAPGSPFKVDDGPTDVAAADLNGDGSPDLISTSGANRTVHVLFGDGRGGFKAGPSGRVPIDADPHLLVTADFDLDRKIDLAVSGHDSNSVTVLLGDGAGRFTPAPESPFAATSNVKPHNHGLAGGDMNGDKRPDLTFGHQDAGVIAVLLGNENGGFAAAPGSPFRVGGGFYPHALGDVNGDGKLDVVAPDIVGSAIVVALGDGRGRLKTAAGSPLAVAPRPFFVLLEDLNGDGHLDVVATHDDSNDVDVLLGDGSGRFTPAPRLDAGHRGWTIASADFNGDGRKDLLVAGAGGLRVYLGDGKGAFRHSPELSVATPRATWKVAVADFNRDRRPDLAYPDGEARTISVLLHR